MEKLKENVKEEMKRIEDKMDNMPGDKGKRNGYGGGLGNVKDCQAGKISEQITKAEFIHWRACVELHVEAVKEWLYTTVQLKNIPGMDHVLAGVFFALD